MIWSNKKGELEITKSNLRAVKILGKAKIINQPIRAITSSSSLSLSVDLSKLISLQESLYLLDFGYMVSLWEYFAGLLWSL